jgi:hypothetical protein
MLSLLSNTLKLSSNIIILYYRAVCSIIFSIVKEATTYPNGDNLNNMEQEFSD